MVDQPVCRRPARGLGRSLTHSLARSFIHSFHSLRRRFRVITDHLTCLFHAKAYPKKEHRLFFKSLVFVFSDFCAAFFFVIRCILDTDIFIETLI